jgi:tRNA pseudouridine32 synthase/23S rRNA pseudouridine746 synthase
MSKHVPADLSSVAMPIVYQDKSFVVVEKPSGLLSVPGTNRNVTDSVRERVERMGMDAEGPLTVHRLDMATSGLMVVALCTDSHRNLSAQFQRRRVSKIYEAVLEGQPEQDSGIVQLAFRKDFENKPRQILDAVHGRMGVTEWRCLSRSGSGARIEFRPVTGRTHQLRVHAAHELGLGSPIAGDQLYGSVKGRPRLMLHARELVFEHPSTRRVMSFISTTPF